MKLTEILNNLKQPIESHHFDSKKKGGKDIPFIPVWNYYELLDQRLGAENWELTLRVDHIGGLAVIIASLTIHGEDRSITRDGIGNEKDDVETWGDSTSNAESQAVRRVCAKFGLSRDLWLKKGKSSPQLPNIPNKHTKKANNVVSLDPNSPAAWYEKGKKDGLNDEQPKYPKVKPYMEGYKAHCPPLNHPEYDPTIQDKTMGV